MVQITVVTQVFSVVTLVFINLLNAARHGIYKVFADILVNICAPNLFNDLF